MCKSEETWGPDKTRSACDFRSESKVCSSYKSIARKGCILHQEHLRCLSKLKTEIDFNFWTSATLQCYQCNSSFFICLAFSPAFGHSQLDVELLSDRALLACCKALVEQLERQESVLPENAVHEIWREQHAPELPRAPV